MATEVQEVAAEAAETVAEEAVEFAEKARGFTSRELSLFAVGTFWGTACGCVAGYFYAKNRLESKYYKLADEEISEMRRQMRQQRAESANPEDKPTLETIVQERGYREDGQPVAYDKVPTEPSVEKEQKEEGPRNVFEIPQPSHPEVEPDWDYAEETKNRGDDPYIIHRDEWNNKEADHDQISLTYFEGDDTLANQQDNVVEDQDKVLGLGNMLKWGHGSGDPNVLYIRNPVLALDIEVTRSMGTYALEVHGLAEEDELTHSSHRVRPHRRFDDEDRS